MSKPDQSLDSPLDLKLASFNARVEALPLLLFTLVYIAAGALSLSTAYVQVNAATVWLPTGLSIGLLLARGRRYWPAVTLGSFLLNASVNILTYKDPQLGMTIAVAAGIAVGNTLEALVGTVLTQRLAGGADYIERPRTLAIFSLVVAPVAALVSTLFGVTASWLGNIAVPGHVLEAAFTWYVANAVGILIFTGPAILLLTRSVAFPPRERLWEALLLLLALVFVSQGITGLYLAEFLEGWPRSYMVIPLLSWAGFRFGIQGAQFAVVVVVGVATVGTMNGFQVFAADTPSRSLLYLQLFLAMLSLMALSIAAARAQLTQLHESLESRVLERTAQIEQLLREKEVFTTIVAHDLKSPLYGVRNALRATADALSQDRIDSKEAVAAMAVMEQTCDALVRRVGALLSPELAEDGTLPAGVRLERLVADIIAAHRLAIDRRSSTVNYSGDKVLAIRRPAELEHVLDILIENAIRHSPPGSVVDVQAVVDAGKLIVTVTDNGEGLGPDTLEHLFSPLERPTEPDSRSPHGLGLHLAHQLTTSLGGTLAYTPVRPRGSRFMLELPSSLIDG